ncbi:hypothetical protein [Halorientalis halophila]|uniref:hypothetical protein n=1 Tax=Halorientalis halophila TaxID=3108499 RepID=UPI00300A2740
MDDQVWLANWTKMEELYVSEDSILRTTQIEEQVDEELEYNPITVIENLEDIGLLEKVEPTGARSFIKSERTQELFYTPENPDFLSLLAEEVDRLFEDLDQEQKSMVTVPDGGDEDGHGSKTTLRAVVAEALEVDEGNVEEAILGEPDPVERLDRYETAVTAIIESDEVERGREYDVMGWRNSANRWGLSSRAEVIVQEGA